MDPEKRGINMGLKNTSDLRGFERERERERERVLREFERVS